MHYSSVLVPKSGSCLEVMETSSIFLFSHAMIVKFVFGIRNQSLMTRYGILDSLKLRNRLLQEILAELLDAIK